MKKYETADFKIVKNSPSVAIENDLEGHLEAQHYMMFKWLEARNDKRRFYLFKFIYLLYAGIYTV